MTCHAKGVTTVLWLENIKLVTQNRTTITTKDKSVQCVQALILFSLFYVFKFLRNTC